jgi:hypothetical protein
MTNGCNTTLVLGVARARARDTTARAIHIGVALRTASKRELVSGVATSSFFAGSWWNTTARARCI